MLLGKVIGRVTATRKNDKLVGTKLLITQPIDPQGAANGTPIIAVDLAGAGVGETVIYAVGSVAAKAYSITDAPIDAAIVGIIDSIDSIG